MAVHASALIALALGGFTLGTQPTALDPIDATIFGCPGTVTPFVAGGAVVAVRFEVPPDGACAPGDDVDPEAVFARVKDGVAHAVGAAPTVDAGATAIWEGARAILIESYEHRDDGEPPSIDVWLVRPDPRRDRPSP